jgi:hypothetical protein
VLFNKKRFGVVALMLVLFLLAGCSFGGKKTYQVVVQTNPPTARVKVYVGSTEGKYLGETNEEGLLEIEEKLEEGTVLIGVKEGYQVRPDEVKVMGDTVKFYVEVIDAADAVERYLERLELIEDIEHYSEVAAIRELLDEAKKAVSIIQDPTTKVKLQADVLAEETRITGILDRYVKAVQNALESDLELLEALGTFWDIDEKLIETYQSLMIAANTEGELETVDDIQKIIEKAPEEAAKAEAAAKIIEAAGKESLIYFRNALKQYGEYLERVNLDHDDANYTILKKYKGAIAGLAAEDPVGIEEIQKEIDGVNREQAEEAVETAVKSLERSDWTRANTLVAYMADDEFQDDLAKLDLVLEVVEAAQNGELGDLYEALEELELEEDVEASLVRAYRDAIVDSMDQLKDQDEISDVIKELEKIIKEAKVTDGIVTTNAKEYTAGDMIEITVKLLYEEQQEGKEPKYLDTLNGEYPAQIFIGPRYYSELLTFTNGVAVAEVRAEKAGDDQQVKVRVKFEDELEMTAEETVKIQAGDAVKLGVTGDKNGASLEAQDAYGNRVYTYEGGKTIKVTYEPKGTVVPASYLIDPDGQVAVEFSEGRTEVSYGSFEFAPDLEDGKNYTFTFTVVEDGLTGTTDYPPTP